LLIADHFSSQSPEVITLCCIVLITAITLGLAAIILRITDGPIFKLPPGVKPVSTHRRKLYPWILGTGFFLLLLLVPAALVAPLTALALLIFAAFVLVVGAILLGGLYIKARRADYAITNLMICFWVHWQYVPGQSEAWFGPAGLLYGGQYLPWLASANYLIEARAELVSSAFLILTFEKFYGRESLPVTIRVPIPEGRESDVQLLEEKLRMQCPKARIQFGAAHRLPTE
jgi:hypothetical protein